MGKHHSKCLHPPFFNSMYENEHETDYYLFLFGASLIIMSDDGLSSRDGGTSGTSCTTQTHDTHVRI